LADPELELELDWIDRIEGKTRKEKTWLIRNPSRSDQKPGYNLLIFIFTKAMLF
jgi:hypothetical protein